MLILLARCMPVFQAIRGSRSFVDDKPWLTLCRVALLQGIVMIFRF